MNPRFRQGSCLGYRPWLDGLRGIAITLVFINHLQFFIYQGGPLFGWLFVPFGGLGVDIFFVLSGFLITTLLLEERGRKGEIALKNFYIRRALRLLPALFVLLVCVVLYSRAFMSSDDANSTARLSVIAIFYCTNWFFAFGGNSDLLGHLWSLAVEEQFYLIWPFVLSLLLRSRLTRRTILLLMLSLVAIVCAHRVLLLSSVTPARVYFGSDTRSDSLLVGCAVAMAVSWQLLPRWTNAAVKFSGQLSIVVAMAYVFDLFGLGRTLYGMGFTIFALAVGLFILRLMVAPSRVVSFLERPALVWIGKLSYSLYLWHFFTIGLTLRLPVANAVRVAISIPISFGMCACSYYMIEKPFLRLKSRYADDAFLAHTEREPAVDVRDQGGPIPDLLSRENI